MIAIQTIKKIKFPPFSTGFIRVELEIIQNKPKEEVFEFKLKDTCYNVVDNKEEELAVNYRYKTFTYGELKSLATISGIVFSDPASVLDSINEIFKKGLLMATIAECEGNLTGNKTGIYFTKKEDWKII
jgi:hypothetical protein